MPQIFRPTVCCVELTADLVGLGFKVYVCFWISLVLRVGEGAGTGFAVVMTTTDDAIVTSRAAFTSVPLGVVLAILIGQYTHQSQPGYSLSVYTHIIMEIYTTHTRKNTQSH